MSYSNEIENIINMTGGCGLHQLITCLIVHVGKAAVVWSTITMAFAGQNPGFYCKNMQVNIETLDNSSLETVSSQVLCSLDDFSKCTSYQFFGHMRTIVSELNLVCERKWIIGMITSLQMVGIMLGCIVAGYTADAYGRKPTFFSGLFTVVSFNFIGYFSMSWKMYVGVRFIIGIGSGAVATTQFQLMIEFAPTKWRAIIIVIPSAALTMAMFALTCWLLPDWKTIHLITAALGVPFLFTWWFLPESIRWLLTKHKVKQATVTVEAIANLNGRETSDLGNMLECANREIDNNAAEVRYSVVDLFRTKDVRKTTFGLSVAWFTVGFGYFGMIFGVNSLSGNLYLNMFLVTIVDAPLEVATGFLVNKFGRKKCCRVLLSLSGVCGIAVGILQYNRFLRFSHVTTVMALSAKMFCSSAGNSIMIYTLELYPTVIRTIAYGCQSTVYRFASAVAPQVVYLNEDVPGLFYFTSGVLMVLSAVVVSFFRETNFTALEDRLTGTCQDENGR